ncbi:MAG: tetratricopeptide repeat protein [Alcanivoracaceae bacterium]|nr:tetratricopeptide repeat protein [Alcanivoracaceae bacterium]
MAERLVRLIAVLIFIAGCATRTAEAPAFDMPSADPLRDSPAEWLWQSGVQAREKNDLPAASRYFERALNVVPDSSWLYRELAELRLRQGDASAAEGLARKALRYAPNDPSYQSVLWQLVATSRQRQGDEEGAERARREAEMLWSRR